jgi:hypothetical protein
VPATVIVGRSVPIRREKQESLALS